MKAKTPEKRVFSSISAVLFSGLLLYVSQLLISSFAGALLFSLFGSEWVDIEWQWMLAEIFLYLLSIIIPGCFLLIVFRKNPFSAFSGPLSTPPLPFLYIPLTIGFMYLVNLTVSMLFGDLLAPFDTPIDADSFPQSPIGIFMYFILVCILPAIFEEWLFRGIIQKNLIPVVGNWSAILLSAFIFGMAHLDPAQSVFAFGFGLFAGYAFKQTGSIWFCALMHMLNNAISVGSSYWTIVYENEPLMILSGLLTMLLMGFGGIALPFYIRYARRNRKMARKTDAERTLPSSKTVLRLIACNPLTYLFIASYCALLWLLYFFTPAV